ncbi:MAG TPA: hypothetical protein VFQ73_05025 [Flavisolibacter sp.]|nr:hypothetical protein [Flavisolibacter sp.]
MDIQEIQANIFQSVKTMLPTQVSLVDEIAAVLDVSTDSAYRRIRGEKLLSLEEAYKLCTRYQLSMDHVLNLQSNSFVFTGNFVKADSFRFDEYMSNILKQVQYMNTFEERQMIYLAKDIPIFHHFHFRELAAFKYYFWMKNIIHHAGFANKKFALTDYPDEYFQLGRKALDNYNNLNTIEVWNIESINSTIRQVAFYHDSDLYTSELDIYSVYEALERLIDHLELQATEGYKFNTGNGTSEPLGKYQLYFNEIVILENSILAILNGKKMAFLVHNVINVLISRDVAFCDNMYGYIQNLLKKSTLISAVSERERNYFFKSIRQKIQSRKQKLKV